MKIFIVTLGFANVRRAIVVFRKQFAFANLIISFGIHSEVLKSIVIIQKSFCINLNKSEPFTFLVGFNISAEQSCVLCRDENRRMNGNGRMPVKGKISPNKFYSNVYTPAPVAVVVVARRTFLYVQ